MIKEIKGNLFQQPVECLVNPWNINIIPWIFLLPQGISGQLLKLAGYKPFAEIWKKGGMAPGQAYLTTGGKLSYKIIHVNTLTWYWKSSENIIKIAVKNTLELATEQHIKSIAFPLLGAGVGGLSQEQVKTIIKEVSDEINMPIDIFIVEKSN